MKIFKPTLLAVLLYGSSLMAADKFFAEEDQANISLSAGKGYNPIIEIGENSYCDDFEDYEDFYYEYPRWSNQTLWIVPAKNAFNIDPKIIATTLQSKPLLSNIIHHPSCKNWNQSDLLVMTPSERDVLLLVVMTYKSRAMFHINKVDELIEAKLKGKVKTAAKSIAAAFITQVGSMACVNSPHAYTAAAVAALWVGFGELVANIPEDVDEIYTHIQEYFKAIYFAELLELRWETGVYPKFPWKAKQYQNEV